MRTKVGKQYNKLCVHMHGVAKLPLKFNIILLQIAFFINLSPLCVVSCKIRENDRKSNLFGPEKETKGKKIPYYVYCWSHSQREDKCTNVEDPVIIPVLLYFVFTKKMFIIVCM